ncbi:MAG: hypothetical protein AB7D39_13210 [Pseudodesulfovibrio sp.]|uniref:hypothetical protein n=1 Tax=Pseudodesulfovibrio sp. TaxID=2035812 RepID=UPI003D0C4A3B
MPHRKDACAQSIGICKLFITLASASIAFIINMIIDPAVVIPTAVKFLATLSMGGSVFAGIASLMHITYRISQGVYDIHADAYRHCASAQIILFAVGVLILGGWALFFV